jgi:hypothetical protein
MDGRLNKRLDKLVTIVINEYVTRALCTVPADDAPARLTRGAVVGAVTVLPLRALPYYWTKLSMARARTMAPLVLASSPRVITSVAKRQQAAAQLVASGAVTMADAEAGTAVVRGGAAAYDVVVSATTMACTCADAGKGNVCKHVRAAVSVLRVGQAYVLSVAPP